MILDYINRQGGNLFSGDIGDIVYQLFLCYNLFLHFGFFPVNSIIIFKEWSLWVLNRWGLEVPTLTGMQLKIQDILIIPDFFIQIFNDDFSFSQLLDKHINLYRKL